MRPSRPLILLLALLFCGLTLAACGSAGKDPFAYANSAFSLSVEGSYLPANAPNGTPRPFAADISVGTPYGEDLTRRDLTLVFTSPASLAGLQVTATLSPSPEGGYARRVELSYPSDYGRVELTADEGELDGFLRFAEGWLPLGDVTEMSPRPSDGYYTVTRKKGEREAVFTFSANGGIPARVEIIDRQGRVVMSTNGSPQSRSLRGE